MISMTSDINDTEQAWDSFVEKRSFEKAASIQGQLDTMAAMIQDIKTDTERTAAIVDQIQGDNAAIDYENANAEPMMPDMAGAEDMMPPEEGMPEGTAEVDDTAEVDETVPPEDSAPAVEGGESPDMAPEGEPEEYMTDEDVEAIMGESMPEEAAGEAPVEQDLIGKIKMMIANTDDPDQLAGLSDLLSTALAQSQPPVPMEGMPEEPMMKSDAGEDNGPVSFTKDADGVADLDDAKDAKDAVTPKLKNEPKVATSTGAGSAGADSTEAGSTEATPTEPFKNSADSEDEVEEKVEVSEEESEPAPEAENPVVEEIVGKVAEAVEGIVESVIEGDAEEKVEEKVEDITEDTESFEAGCSGSEGYMKSSGFGDLFAARASEIPGVDGQFMKMESRPATKEDKEAGGLFGNAFESMKHGVEYKATDKSKDYDNAKFAEEMKESKTEETEEEAEEKPKKLEKSAKDAGKHIASFREMYSGRNDFTKSAGSYAMQDRPGRASMIGGTVERPNPDNIKQQSVPSFEQMMAERAQNNGY